MSPEVLMKMLWVFGAALALPVSQACTGASPSAQTAAKPLDRSCRVAIAASAGTDPDIPKLQQALRDERQPARTAEQLGYRFVARARLSNDPGFYTLAEQTAVCMESIEPGDPAALLLRGHVLHQMHRFGEAELIARRLVTLREFVLDYGLLGDALMEQGRLAEAAGAYQKMIDLKPFYQSYTRAAHLRWLKGDLDGAIEMMHAAIRTVSPRDPESAAWAYSRLAFYELQRGRLADAGRMTDAALRHITDYSAALLVRGRIQLAQRRPQEAAATLERAVRLNPLPEYAWALADVLRSLNRIEDARVVEERLAAAAPDDPRTFALYLSTRRADRAKAIDLARRELQKRGDIFTLDALAWALAAAGETREASALITRALAEGTQDGRLFLHAAVIAAADGRPADAKHWAGKARALQFTLLPSELGVLRTGILTSPQS
jgi:tetratricopeptide (TPR) repeat protein